MWIFHSEVSISKWSFKYASFPVDGHKCYALELEQQMLSIMLCDTKLILKQLLVCDNANYTEQKYDLIVASLRHTCAMIMLSNQNLDMPNLWGGMDYLCKGEMLTNTDLDRSVNNIW